MISVSISINGEPIYARSARRVGGESGEMCTYLVDDGNVITHHYDDGAVILAKKMLDCIKEI